MKKLIFALPLIFFLFPFLLLGAMLGGGQASYDSKVVASQEQAYDYQYISSELGVPWDIVMLTDAISAWWGGEDSIEHYNPIVTALEFAILQEDIYWAEPVYEEILIDSFPHPDGSGTIVFIWDEVQVGIRWVLAETVLYTGCDEILAYINRSRDYINTKDATDIVVEIMLVAENKSCDEWKYDNTLVGNLDYDYVLGTLLGLAKEDIEGVIELYHAQYMSELYGYIQPQDELDEIELPDLIPGNGITRMDLARVAVSLINWPYQLGSKSPYKGIPIVPLDCSGYIDWVYIQCFGIGVSAGGRVPAGVAISGTAIQFYASDAIDGELKIGDLGFTKHPKDVKPGEFNHVGIYLGTIGGQQAWIHCAGKTYGYDERPSGRVGISLPSGTNNYNHINGTTYEPAMKSITFNYFRRPRYTFADDD